MILLQLPWNCLNNCWGILKKTSHLLWMCRIPHSHRFWSIRWHRSRWSYFREHPVFKNGHHLTQQNNQNAVNHRFQFVHIFGVIPRHQLADAGRDILTFSGWVIKRHLESFDNCFLKSRVFRNLFWSNLLKISHFKSWSVLATKVCWDASEIKGDTIKLHCFRLGCVLQSAHDTEETHLSGKDFWLTSVEGQAYGCWQSVMQIVVLVTFLEATQQERKKSSVKVHHDTRIPRRWILFNCSDKTWDVFFKKSQLCSW